jgi:hypothetical protein
MESLAEDEVRAYAGRNAEYYVARWAAARAPRRSFETNPSLFATGFNWAAFFLGVAWLAYRKLWVHAAVLGVVVLCGSLGTDLVYRAFLGREDLPWLVKSAWWVIGLICGAVGNRWVLARAARIAAEVRSKGVPPEDGLRELGARGGTNFPAALVLVVAFLVACLLEAVLVLVVRHSG